MKKKVFVIISTAIATLGCVFLISGCKTAPTYKVESDPEVDFTSYKTFAMMPLPSQIPGAEPDLILRIGDIVQATLEDELKSKGYTQLDIDSADFTVNVTGKVVPKVDVSSFGYMPGDYSLSMRWHHHPYSTSYRNSIYVDNYEEGTLIVEIYDTKTKKPVWVGWTTNRRDPKGVNLKLVAEKVRGVIDGFPECQ